MGEILLAGVMHKMARKMSQTKLMSPGSEALFAKRVLPRLTNDSILYIEGSHGLSLVSNDAKYESTIATISSSLVESGKKPKIIFVDPRAATTSEKSQKFLDDLMSLMEFGNRWITMNPCPQEVSELLELVKSGSLNVKLKINPNKNVKQAASYVASMLDKFDANYIAGMTEHASQHDHCVLLAGSSHCIRIHLKTNWPLDILRDYLEDGSDLEGMYRGYIAGSVLPKVIRGW